jgi:metal-responsive CopG/Arc/MetJ family transcriptional regulator
MSYNLTEGEAMKNMTVKIPDHVLTQLDRIARERSVAEDRYISRSEVVNKALTDYLRKQRKEQPNVS